MPASGRSWSALRSELRSSACSASSSAPVAAAPAAPSGAWSAARSSAPWRARLHRISFSLQVGIALGISATLVAWPIVAALGLRGYDWEELRRRFVPQASIDAARETKAFVEARLPRKKEEEA